MKKTKTIVTTVLIVLIFVAGLGLMLYPTISDYISSLSHKRVISDYVSSVENLDESTYTELLTQAEIYNTRLAARKGSLTTLSDEAAKEYYSILDVNGTGVMGYVQIPSLDLSLPIYHGSDDAVLQVGVGHLEGSSLPVGGESCHTILTGHRGLPSSQLFTSIDKLVEGDVFMLRVLKETFTYQVDQIETVLPSELSSLVIVDGEDYCTLVTCTPYGVNTHRLLVRGRRIENFSDTDEIPIGSYGQTETKPVNILILISIAVAVALVPTVIITARRRRS